MKQDCKTILPLLTQMADGSLDQDAAWKVQMHVSVCAGCARVSQELLGTARLIKGLSQKELPGSFDTELAARIAALTPAEVRRGRLAAKAASLRRNYGWSLRLSVAALAATLLFAALVIWVPTRTVSPQVTPVGASTSDSALIAACLRQHHSYVASDPLADPSAQSLASQVDSALNVDSSGSATPSPSPENM